MTTLGCALLPTFPPHQYLPIARAADDAGLAEICLWEDCFKETGIAAAGAILASTANLRVQLGVLPVPLRNVALTAMEIATLEGMFPGRLEPGIGHGVQSWMEQVGARAASPLTLLREYATALRGLLAGERLTVSGRYVSLDDVALDWPPVTAPPVISAATGPKTLRLVGEVADGVALDGGNGLTKLRTAIDTVRKAYDDAGRTDPFKVVVSVATATGPDAPDRVRAWLPSWDLPSDAPEEYCVWGDSAEEIADGLRRFADLGADTVNVQPLESEPDPEALVTFLGQEVRPLLL
ncbi:LLM class flavin-dependent oxidoreductase [Myceligenerans pegani]|uniref:LLM class flavin-dependent oxidoreductase n=1 Tax=Myceligenerans pegani TaxID=2776917 RepID=A0ABR9N237_9MICO|nr:LLM class flavin-dependent oxidoreductase [Myceligenerans sp. TRM 65318]MBE1877072.1 LLM class flavin-dependent oxidoreductase [Myceligenerans sp. TRM 65318]MBE3019343.1 LLM class flavin-dependent oxidoreductase [Myceligenerans sp. TRM 65318]